MRRAGALGLAVALSACAGPGPERLSWSDLDGWAGADHAAALSRMGAVPAGGSPRAALEARFAPVVLPGAADALVTGYYEPVLAAAETPSGAFSVPLHGLPADPAALDVARGAAMDGALKGRAPVLYWLADPVEAFFLHVQGSGRLRLRDGREVRVGYAGRNAHPYRSIGRIAVEEGLLPLQGLTADRLKHWLREHPEAGRALMARNPSYIFFREVAELAPEEGPVGASGIPLVAGLSAALDPEVYPPGSLVWVEADGPGGSVRRLLVAEDTGAAIRGAGRVDIFLGTGAEAGRRAGMLSARGRIVWLRPRASAPQG